MPTGGGWRARRRSARSDTRIQGSSPAFLSAGVLESVADAGFSENTSRPRRVELKLVAQIADEDAQIGGVLDMRRSPQLVEDMAVRQHLASIGHQLGQQLVFLGRQAHFGAAALHDAAHQIDRKIAGDEERLLALLLE